MSKRKIAVAAVIFLIAATILLAAFFYRKASQTEPVVGEPFSLSDYQWVLDMEEFSSDRQVGRIEGVQDAAEKAEAVWLEVYGETVEGEKPYVVSRDSSSGVWFVSG